MEVYAPSKPADIKTVPYLNGEQGCFYMTGTVRVAAPSDRDVYIPLL